jgi:hypothetical protein
MKVFLMSILKQRVKYEMQKAAECTDRPIVVRDITAGGPAGQAPCDVMAKWKST